MRPARRKVLWWTLGSTGLATVLVLVTVCGVVFAALGGSLTGCENASAQNPPPSTNSSPAGPQPSEYALQSIPPERLALYEAAGRRYDIDWSFLASIGAQECGSGDCAGTNGSGCAGPMQIAYVPGSPCSPGSGPTLWERYGVSIHPGQAPDVNDPGDAIYTAARILREAMGAPPTGGSYQEYRQAACSYYGACSDATVAYAEEVMARAVQYGFDGAGSPAPSAPPLAQPPSEEPPSLCGSSSFTTGGGGGSSAIVKVAESQLGQGETPEGSNCTRYGPCEEWCSLFVAWVWQHSGAALPGTPAEYAYSGALYTWVQQHTGRVLPPTARPSPGDAVFYGTGPEASVHVGIVARVLPGGQIETIEGNYDNHVERVGPFAPSDPVGEDGPIYGYAQPPSTTDPSRA